MYGFNFGSKISKELYWVIVIGVDHILLGEKSMWMEDKLNHSLLFDSLSVQNFSLGIGSKGCFTTCPKHGKWGDFWGTIARANQGKIIKNIPILAATWFLLLSSYRITGAWVWGNVSTDCPGLSLSHRQAAAFFPFFLKG